jgi:hypothetical protein
MSNEIEQAASAIRGRLAELAGEQEQLQKLLPGRAAAGADAAGEPRASVSERVITHSSGLTSSAEPISVSPACR